MTSGSAARRALDRGIACEQEGRYAEAVEAYQAAVASPDAEPSWSLQLGRALERSGELEEARKVLAGALASGSGGGLWQHRLGRICERLGRFDEAAAAYEVAIRSPKASPDWSFRLARALHRAGDPERARLVLVELLGRGHAVGSWHLRLGLICDELGRDAEAVTAYRAAVGMSDVKPHWFLRLAAALLRIGELCEANRELIKASSTLEPEDAVFAMSLAANFGLWEAAATCATRHLELTNSRRTARKLERYVAFADDAQLAATYHPTLTLGREENVVDVWYIRPGDFSVLIRGIGDGQDKVIIKTYRRGLELYAEREAAANFALAAAGTRIRRPDLLSFEMRHGLAHITFEFLQHDSVVNGLDEQGVASYLVTAIQLFSKARIDVSELYKLDQRLNQVSGHFSIEYRNSLKNMFIEDSGIHLEVLASLCERRAPRADRKRLSELWYRFASRIGETLQRQLDWPRVTTHGDLKPENVGLIDSTVVLFDWQFLTVIPAGFDVARLAVRNGWTFDVARRVARQIWSGEDEDVVDALVALYYCIEHFATQSLPTIEKRARELEHARACLARGYHR